MSIWRQLYEIFDSERAKWQSNSASKQALVFELKSNLTFLADAIQNELVQAEVINGLEHAVFDDCLKKGLNFNRICARTLSKNTIGDFEEFSKYLNKDSHYLVSNAYARMASLIKLHRANKDRDYRLKIKSLFRFQMLLVAHIEDRQLRRRVGKKC